jgi:hypothetical protein
VAGDDGPGKGQIGHLDREQIPFLVSFQVDISLSKIGNKIGKAIADSFIF